MPIKFILLILVMLIIGMPQPPIMAGKFDNPWMKIDRTQAPDFKRRVRKFLKNKVNTEKYQEMNKLFDSLDCEFSLDLIKAIAWQESRWQQFNPNGTVTQGINYRTNKKGEEYIHSVDYGIMQINNKTSSLDPRDWDFERIKTDTHYNIQAGIQVLRHKVAYAQSLQKRSDWKRFAKTYNLTGKSTIEIAIKAYNGMRYSNIYINRVNHARLLKPWEKSKSVIGHTGIRTRPQLPKADVGRIKKNHKKGQAVRSIINNPVFLGDPVMD